MKTDLEKLLAKLELEQADANTFVGRSPKFPPRIFGGQVLAQALNASTHTIDRDFLAHSMHAYFLRPGNPKKQIVYKIDAIRDGRNFATRQVVASQDERVIFSASLSFQRPENGPEHQIDPLDYPGPEGIEGEQEFWARMSKEYPDRFYSIPVYPIERRPLFRPDYLNPEEGIGEPKTACWLRANGRMGDDPIQHQTVLTYMSDLSLMGAALRPHPHHNRSKNVQFASIDHALWLHRPTRADEWLLYVHDSPTAAGARGLTRGTFYTRSGELVASVGQEVLLRVNARSKQ